MATKVHMEALSPTMEEGQVVKWLKSEGDGVKNGDIIAEPSTGLLLATGLGQVRSSATSASHRLGCGPNTVAGAQASLDQLGADRRGQCDLAIDLGRNDQCDRRGLVA